MREMLLKRLLAFLIDYGIIALYAFTLFGVTRGVIHAANISLSTASPVMGQAIGFLTLSLPVFLYFFFFEISRFQATWGKKLMGIKVVSNHIQNQKSRKILVRNVLKFLPWEIAHTGVHWLMYYSGLNIEPPHWIWIVLILPQIIVLGYLISIFTSGGSRSIYDKAARTKVVLLHIS